MGTELETFALGLGTGGSVANPPPSPWAIRSADNFEKRYGRRRRQERTISIIKGAKMPLFVSHRGDRYPQKIVDERATIIYTGAT